MFEMHLKRIFDSFTYVQNGIWRMLKSQPGGDPSTTSCYLKFLIWGVCCLWKRGLGLGYFQQHELVVWLVG
jgi:hypothetical protein